MLEGESRSQFLQYTAYARLEQLTGVCNEFARPWTEFYTPPTIAEKWYETY